MSSEPVPDSSCSQERRCARASVARLWSVLCSLSAFEWRAQFYTAGNILVEDHLAFAVNADFAKNTTAYPFQACAANSVVWLGNYVQVNATHVELNHMQCSATSVGCVGCGLTRTDVVETLFATDCESMTLVSLVEQAPRTYVAIIDR
jgi:hypothetical protein